MKTTLSESGLIQSLLALCLLCSIAFAQQKVAILGTEDDGDEPLRHQELAILTAKLRDIAKRTLPAASYNIMTEQSIVSFLGSSEEMEKICEAADGCLAKIGRDIEADFVGQARIARFGKLFTIKMEVYDVVNGTLSGTFTDDTSEDMYGLLAVIDNKAPAMFRDIHLEHSVTQSLKESEALTKALKESEPTKEEYKEPVIAPQVQEEVKRGSKIPFWAGIALEAIGAGLIVYGIMKDEDIVNGQKKYDGYNGDTAPEEFKSRKNKMNDAKSMRNTMYISGGVAAALGIGVHLWF